MKDPLISIIIPTYNNGHFFNRLLNSLLNQSYTNWEAIIIDNNSNDSTLSIISEFNDSRFKVHQINNNGIIAKSRNFGIKKATGKWIAFLDSDDWWDPNKLSYCYNYIKLGYELIYHKLEIKHANNFEINKNLHSRKNCRNLHKDLLINGNFIPNSSVVIKKNIVDNAGPINEDLEMVGSEDYNYWLKISNYTNKVKYISKRLGYYYISEHGISQKNMSFSYEHATKEFVNNCTSSEKYFIKAHIEYINTRYKMKLNNYNGINQSLIFCIINGTYRIKIKSIYHLLISIFK